MKNRVWNLVLTLPLSLVACGLVASCSSPPVKPEGKNIKVTREEVDSDCKDLGPVEGRSLSAKATFEDALEDLKTDAARKGATDVRIEQTSGTGTAVRGTAYLCR